MHPSKTILTVALLAASLLPAVAAEKVDQILRPPNADQFLRAMSAKLAAARSFTFEASREMDAELRAAHDVPGKAKIAVAVQRPNKLAARAATSEGVRQFIFDGRVLSVLDAKKNHYATVSKRTTIDGLVDLMGEVYGFTPPLAEFALSDPYADIRRHAHTVTYLGLVKTGGFLGMGGIECHRIGLKGKLADAELLIAVSDQLPRKLVATFHAGSRPQMRIGFSAWNLSPTLNAADFTFTPPAGAQKIEIWTTAKMKAALKP